MSGPMWKNVYSLSEYQISALDRAEEHMQMLEINEAEEILKKLIQGDADCIPALNNLAHLYGRYLSDFDLALEYYERVLILEPDNAWARDERRRYRRYQTYD